MLWLLKTAVKVHWEV